MEETNKKQHSRLNNISVLRLLLCIAVFVYHYITFFVSKEIEYIMPSTIPVFGFAFLSAFLYSNKKIDDPKQWLKRNLLKLFIPIIVYLLLGFFLLVVVGMIKYSCNFEMIFANFIGYNPTDGGPNFVFGNLWFLGMLSLCYIVTPFCDLNRYSKKGKIIFLSIIISICAIEVVFNFFCFVFTCYIISYYLGKKLFKPISNESPRKGHIPLIGILSLLLVASSLLWYLYVGHLPDGYFPLHIKMLKHGVMFIYSLSFCMLFIYLFKFLNRFKIKVISNIEKYTFPFYMAHQLYMVGTLCFYPLIPNWYFLPLIALTCLTAFLVDLLSSLVIKKIFPVKQKST